MIKLKDIKFGDAAKINKIYEKIHEDCFKEMIKRYQDDRLPINDLCDTVKYYSVYKFVNMFFSEANIDEVQRVYMSSMLLRTFVAESLVGFLSNFSGDKDLLDKNFNTLKENYFQIIKKQLDTFFEKMTIEHLKENVL